MFNLKTPNTFLLITILIFLFNFSASSSYTADKPFRNFNNKSIFFTSLNTDSNFSLDEFNLDSESRKPHKTDTVIIKLESDDPVLLSQPVEEKSFLSIQITHQFYKIYSCTDADTNDVNTSNTYDKIFNNFVKISKDQQTCYKRQDYFSKDFTRSTNNVHIDLLNKKLYTENELKYENYYSTFKIKDYLNINLREYNDKIINFLSDFLMWNEFSYYELVFVYNKQTQKFLLSKIFIFFSFPHEKLIQLEREGNYYFITLIKNGMEVFDNIFIYYKRTKKLMKFTKNYKESGNNKITISDFNENLFNYPMNISTRKSESIFHNSLTVKFKSQTIDNFIKKFESQSSLQNKIKEICFFVYQHLTEDTYIEKNEFRNDLEAKYKKNKIEYSYSDFIDQELSSDLTEQYYTSFILCDDIENLENEGEYELSYLIHFRYQPSISDSSKTHQKVMMPHPYIEVLNKNNTIQVPDLNKILFNNYLLSQNIIDKDPYFVKVKRGETNKNYRNDKFDERKIFKEEVLMKLKYTINDFNFHISNKENFIHKIPAGRQKHFWITAIFTTMITFIGFMIILYALVIYSLTPSKDKKEESKEENQEDLNLLKKEQ